MEDNNGGMKNSVVIKKKRSSTCRRPNNLLSKPLELDNSFSRISSDDIPAFDTNPRRRKEFSLSQCISRADSLAANNGSSSTSSPSRSKRSTEGLLAPVSWKKASHREDEGNVSNGLGDELDGERKKKMKVKISGLSRLVNNASNGSSRKPVNGDATTTTTRSNHNVEESSDDCDDDDSPIDKKADLLEGNVEKDMTGKRKGKRAPKKRVFDSDDDDNDDEIRFIEKLRNRNNNVSVVSNNEDTEESGKSKKKPDGENSGYAAAEVEEEEEREQPPVVETSLTSRQRALASGSGRSTAIEFPDGLPPTSRRKKETLSATEQQLKKAEAAQRRKVQIEKAARESEAEAIRKILGQDSSRKKREDKIKKRLDELAQEKAAHEEMASTNFIRTIMGANGTTVSFPIDKVPSLFDSKPVCYPPPRENCAGPSCTNPYKYRDSKTNVPLCSLKCYKTVQEKKAD